MRLLYSRAVRVRVVPRRSGCCQAWLEPSSSYVHDHGPSLAGCRWSLIDVSRRFSGFHGIETEQTAALCTSLVGPARLPRCEQSAQQGRLTGWFQIGLRTYEKPHQSHHGEPEYYPSLPPCFKIGLKARCTQEPIDDESATHGHP